MKIVVSGGTGYIGRALTAALVGEGHHVVVLTRQVQPRDVARVRMVTWDPADAAGAWTEEIADAGALVNLAGASIGRPFWTRRRRRVLRSSRWATTAALVAAVTALEPARRPRVLVSASAVDYYGDRGDDEVTEDSGPGTSFLASVAAEWERVAAAARDAGTRVVLLRQGVVLGPAAPALRLMALPFRLFVGGPVGSGEQWFSWIHIDDDVRLFRHVIADDGIDGPVNAVAPGAVRQHEFAEELGRVLHRPSALRAPASVMRLALRGQADVLLHGHRVEPVRALATGFDFHFPALPAALEDALRG